MTPVTHITYATSDRSRGADCLKQTARSYGIETRIQGPDEPIVASLRDSHPEIMKHGRGAGYWLWKPHIIREALASAKDGSLVLYTDADFVFVADPAPMFALAETASIVLFKITPDVRTGLWTKRDAFVLLDADHEDYWSTPMILSGVQLYRADDRARSFIDEVCQASADERVLTDQPNVMGQPDIDGFVAHRHDQSVLTIVAHRHGIAGHRDPTQYGNDPQGGSRRKAQAGQYFFTHRKRNPEFPYWWLRWKLGLINIGNQH